MLQIYSVCIIYKIDKICSTT